MDQALIIKIGDMQRKFMDQNLILEQAVTFDHAVKEAIWNQNSNRFAVIFNGKTILDYLPSDYEIHSQKSTHYGRYGKNELHFVGKGLSDARGSQVDNIKLVRKGAYG